MTKCFESLEPECFNLASDTASSPVRARPVKLKLERARIELLLSMTFVTVGCFFTGKSNSESVRPPLPTRTRQGGQGRTGAQTCAPRPAPPCAPGLTRVTSSGHPA